MSNMSKKWKKRQGDWIVNSHLSGVAISWLCPQSKLSLLVDSPLCRALSPRFWYLCHPHSLAHLESLMTFLLSAQRVSLFFMVFFILPSFLSWIIKLSLDYSIWAHYLFPGRNMTNTRDRTSLLKRLD